MPKRAAQTEEYESDRGFVDDAPKGKSSSSKKAKMEKKGGDVGATEWELTKNKRVAISDYKGKTMIDIREMYEKDGEKLPGRKGIALPTEQFQTLVDSLPEIIIALEDKGVLIKIPNFGGASATKKIKKVEESSSEEEEKVADEDEDDEDE